jgi:hypothetical protein
MKKYVCKGELHAMNTEFQLSDDPKSTEQQISGRMRRAGRGSVWSAARIAANRQSQYH